MQLENSDVLVRMFTLGEPTVSQTEHKRLALQRLPETFGLLNDDNFKEYVNYLQEWILNEVDDWAFRLFVSRLKMLHDYLANLGRHDLCEQLLPINYQLLKQDDESTRRATLQLTCQMLASSYGTGYVRKFVQNQLKPPFSYPNYDSALTIFGKFRERFYDNNDFIAIINHPNLYACYKSKKILAGHLASFAADPMPAQVLKAMLTATEVLLKDSDEVICVMALKSRILLILNSFRCGFATQQKCLQQIAPFYSNTLLRVKYTLIELTAQMCEMFPQNGIAFHFEFIKSNIRAEEPELTELSIAQLKNIFLKVSKQEQESLLERLLSQKADVGIEGTSYQISEAIAANIIDLLVDVEKEDKLVGFLSKFVKGQSESVKLILVKSFFKHQKSAHLYVYFKSLLDELYVSTKWRARHQSLLVLQKVIDKFGIEQDILTRLYDLIINDPAHRVRVDSIHLAKRFIQDPKIQEQLVPSILNQYLNTDYLRRLMVLHFIEETYKLLVGRPLIVARYKQVLGILSTDPVANVSDIARRLLHGDFAVL